MFYRAGEPHGLKHNPFNAIVVPRPIGWISSLDAGGSVNLAPYSFFNAVAYVPPQVIFCGSRSRAKRIASMASSQRSVAIPQSKVSPR